MGPIRALFLTALAVTTLTACKPKSAISTEDMSLGNPKASVKVIEYGSVACPHCAMFNNDVFPAFKAKYIDTGQIYYTYREALTGEPAQLAAAGALIARCSGKDKYFLVNDAIFRDQANIQNNMREGLLRVAQAAGMSEADFEKCLSDVKAIDAINKRADRMIADGVDGTPAFLVNGKVVAVPPGTETSLADLDAAIAKAKAAGPAK